MRKRYLVLAVVLILGTIFIKLTLNFWVNIMPECFFLKITGFYCPGCGGTRAVISMLNGNFIRAFRYNPGIVSLGFIIATALFEKLFNKKILPRNLIFWIVFIIILFSYYILRNFTLSLSAL